MIEHEIRTILADVLTEMDLADLVGQIIIEVPRNEEHGDYATNIAFLLAKRLRKAPPVIAAELAARLDSAFKSEIKATPAGGFINFILSDDYIHRKIMLIDERFGHSNVGAGARHLIEFVSANPTGPLHIGHGRWAAIGDSIVRLLRATGYQVSSEFYINDTGNQIRNFYASVAAVKQGQPIPEDGYHGGYVLELAEVEGDPVQLMLAHQRKVLTMFRCEFDSWQSEAQLHAEGHVNKFINILRQSEYAYTLDGALWFRSTAFGDDKDRVLVRENGAPTYFAADIAYHYHKFERGIDHAVNIWGADHHGYVKRMQAALSVILADKLGAAGKSIDDYFTVVIGQLVKLYRDGQEVRMSKRTGDMITLEDVIEEIGVDAARYFLAMKSHDQMLEFDLNLAKEQSNNNPVYYVQYAHARICSILRKASGLGQSATLGRKLEDEERKLLIKLLRLPRQVVVAAREYSPYLITQYMEELAAVFHSFYQKCKVITDDAVLSEQRVAYIDRVRRVLQTCLDLVGVSAPERM